MSSTPSRVSAERSTDVAVWTVTGGIGVERRDSLAIEEPLDIRLTFGPEPRTLSVSLTMRTPGHDAELAVGFLMAEGILPGPEAITAIDTTSEDNVVTVIVEPEVRVNLVGTDRYVTTTSACGICGKTTLDSLAIRCQFPPPDARPVIPATLIHDLPRRMREAQSTFDSTGGLHAAGLFDSTGTLLAVREDVGRHNAVDKLIGAEWLANRVPLTNRILVVSGRASYELLQKALLGGVPIFVAVGAPSSLAANLAREFGVTLVGFARDGRFNIYSAPERIQFM